MPDHARTTLITGGASGIGAATTRALLNGGESVSVTGLDQDRLTAFAEHVDASEQLLTLRGDATEASDVHAAVGGGARAVRSPGRRNRQRGVDAAAQIRAMPDPVAAPGRRAASGQAE